MADNKKNIGVFFGSNSTEHDISIITAQLVIAGLKGLGYSVTPIYITKTGKWMLGEDLGNLKLFTDPNKKIEDKKKYYEYYLDLEESLGKMVFRRKGLISRSITVDIHSLHSTALMVKTAPSKVCLKCLVCLMLAVAWQLRQWPWIRLLLSN